VNTGAPPRLFARYFARLLTKQAFHTLTRTAFRNTLVQLGQSVCKSPEQFKAWSQNLGHENTLTTFLSYGEVAGQRQGEIMRDLAKPEQSVRSDAEVIGEAVFRKIAGFS